MIQEREQVRSYMRLSSVFVYEEATIFDVFEAMKKYSVETISVVKQDFSIIGYVDKRKIRDYLKENLSANINELKNVKIRNLIRKNEFPIVIYPGTSLLDAYKTMDFFNIKCLPVVDLPWEKRIVGFLWFDDILPVIEKDYLKIPV